MVGRQWFNTRCQRETALNKNRILNSFEFDLVDESVVTNHISTLRTKNSYGHDGISMKLSYWLE